MGILKKAENTEGKCLCGCGAVTPVATKTDRRAGQVKGQHIRFIGGHNARLNHGPGSPNWKGGIIVAEGRHMILMPDHHRADSKGYVYRHILVAESALGRPLPDDVEVHHGDCQKGNDSNGNLVICQDRAYHSFLHQRTRALQACGHANWLKCHICKQYDVPANMYIYPDKLWAYHTSCKVNYNRKLKEGKNGITSASH